MSGEERNFTDIYKTIEAILFATGDPVTYEKLGMLLELTPAQVKSIALDMAEEYTNRGIQLLCYDTACQLCTKEEYEDIIKDALGIKKNGALSKSCLETLAIIAYNQPVTRTYVEEVRGVDSAYAFGVLMQRELIEIKGRLDVPGRPNLYATTKKFLRVFGLGSLNELPSVEALSVVKEEAAVITEEAEEKTEE
ncbi:MAG: SMC-Scp complex subunit ScpB [Clostridia bacterium]|nr:SMC-Scp complex subunit ScpB [Clostridia bacterium]